MADKLPIFGGPPTPGSSAPITNIDFNKLMELPYDPANSMGFKKVNETDAPNAGPRKKNPITAIFAMHDMVIFERRFPSATTGLRRTPVLYTEAVRRMNAVMESLFREDGSKPQDELEYEKWLQEQTIKACYQCSINVGKPYTSKSVEAKLRQIDIAAKLSKNRKGHPDSKA